MNTRREFIIVLGGGLYLAMVAGYLNSIMILLGAPPVTHLTGPIAQFSTDLGREQVSNAFTVVLLVASFMGGAMLAGMIVVNNDLRLSRRYFVAIFIESALIAIAAFILPHSMRASIALTGFAAGLQNALASSYKSLIIRTTHVTGVLTDIGFAIGRIITGKQRPDGALLLHTSIVVAFILGGVVGAIVGTREGGFGLWYAAAALALLGVGYLVYRGIAFRR